MKRKIKQVVAAFSMAAFLFTTAVALPEKAAEIVGVTASAIDANGETQTTDVASVTIDGTTTNYTDITAAWNAAMGNTAYVTLLQDVDIGSIELSVNNNSNLTLDCGGYTLTGIATDTINIINGSLTVKNGTVKNTSIYATTIVCGNISAAVLTVESSAVIKSDKGDCGICVQQNSSVNIYGTVQSGETGVYAKYGTLNVYPGAVISGDKYGIRTSAYNDSNIFLYGGTICGGENAIYRNQKGTINVAEDMTVKLGDVVLTSPITESTAAGTISVACSGAHSFYNTVLDADGKVTCMKCPAKALAVAKVEKNGTTFYVDESSFADAFKYVNSGAAITLTNDVNLTKSLTISGGTFTLIGNGRTITSSSNSYGAIELTNSGKLNITDCAIVSTKSYGAYVHNKGKINITNCAITTERGFISNCVVYVDGSDSEANITGSTITKKGNYGSVVSVSGNGKVSITDSTIKATGESSYGISLQKSAGEVVINGGEISGTGTGLFFYNATVKINGGRFSSINIGNTGDATLSGTLGSVDNKLCAYYDESGKPILLESGQKKISGSCEVRVCKHDGITPTDNGNYTHTLTCP